MMRRVILGSNFERAGGGESPVMKPLMKNTLEQLTEKILILVGLDGISPLSLVGYRLASAPGENQDFYLSLF